MHIELRNDGWWDAGKLIFPDHYRAKQDLKKSLEAIGEQSDRKSLEKELRKVQVPSLFASKPYVSVGERLQIETEGAPGECYLGKIVN